MRYQTVQLTEFWMIWSIFRDERQDKNMTNPGQDNPLQKFTFFGCEILTLRRGCTTDLLLWTNEACSMELRKHKPSKWRPQVTTASAGGPLQMCLLPHGHLPEIRTDLLTTFHERIRKVINKYTPAAIIAELSAERRSHASYLLFLKHCIKVGVSIQLSSTSNRSLADYLLFVKSRIKNWGLRWPV